MKERSATLVVPGPLGTLTGGYGYDRRMADGLRARGWCLDVVELDAGFPFPSVVARGAAARALAAIPDNTTVLVDGLALGAMPMEAEREATRLRLVALVHHPLALETGLDRETADALEVSERRALAAARLVIVTSAATAAGLGRYGVDPDRVIVAPPGTDRAPLARGTRPIGAGQQVHLLSVATLTARKGHEQLVRALASLAHRAWQLTIVGSLERDPQVVARVRAVVQAAHLEGRVRLAGEAAGRELEAYYDAADLFVLATFHEGYGMVIAEALARGLPIISTRTGAIAELVGADAGLLVEPGDELGLTTALAHVFDDVGLRTRLIDGARRARQRLRTWDEAVDIMVAALDRISRDG